MLKLLLILCLTSYVYLHTHSHEHVDPHHGVEIEVDEREPVFLVSHGDQRQSANKLGWPAQLRLEKIINDYVDKNGYRLVRGHPYDEKLEHGFIYSQKMGIEVFRKIPKNAKLIVAISVWCYSHHVLAGLRDHEGDILLLANWSGEWPGLVGMLNLAGSLTKMGKEYERLWTKDGQDDYFKQNMREWLKKGRIQHDISHVTDIEKIPTKYNTLDGVKLGLQLKRDKAIMCIFDEGCMGMYNAIFDDELVNKIGIYKERLSQSYLVSQMAKVTDEEAKKVKKWLDKKGFTFVLGTDSFEDLTLEQVLEQMKMYIAVVRIADDFGCDLVGVQYQQGLVHSTAASDLPEGLWNNRDRPPVYRDALSSIELFPGEPLIHFNEVDEGAAVDALINNRVCNKFNIDPATTLHDIRYGEEFEGKFVWVFEISGAVPPSHLIGGYKGASSERQPNMYFPLGGGSLKGVSRPGDIIWSRVYVKDNELHCDIGTGKVIELPKEEQERRWRITTPQWPVMNAVLDGVTKTQMMAFHNANHIQVVYVPGNILMEVFYTKVQMMLNLGIKVHLCGLE